MTKFVSQRLGCSPAVTLTINGLIQSVPEKDNHTFVSKSCYDLFATIPLFLGVDMAN